MCKIICKDNTKRDYFFEFLCLKSQKSMKTFLSKEMRKRGRKVEVGDGYIYSPGTVPIILTAHMDTVHTNLPKEIVYEDGKISSPQGIGGDDRCGIYMILNIIREHDCHVLFFEDEEYGGRGSQKFVKTETCKSLEGKINYAIALDRANANDAVYYNCNNKDFVKFIEQNFWEMAYGSYTDICEICPEIGCAGVNLSCGYYNQHTFNEYVVIKEMRRAIKEVKRLIKRTTDNDVFDYIESAYDYKYYSNDYNKLYGNSIYEIVWEQNGEEWIENQIACSKAEALGLFMQDNPKICYADVLYVVEVFDYDS